MLHVTYTDNQDFSRLFAAVFNQAPPKGIWVTFMDDEAPLGVAVISLPDTQPVIRYVGLLPQYRGKGLGDYFFRSLFYTLTQGGNGLYVDWEHPYFSKFGFKRAENGKLYVSAEELCYPSGCGGH